MTDPAVRERRATRLLDAWPWTHGGVIIGGYAVAAYGRPRYSNDVDIAVPTGALEALTTWLQDRGFHPTQVPEDLEQNYAGRIARYRRDEVTVDLLPGVVRDRDAQVDVPYAWIARSPRRMRLVLLDASTRTRVPVVRPEAFWVLKLLAGRAQDLADLYAIRGEPVDLHEVRSFLARHRCDPLTRKLQRVVARLDDGKLYRDTLSRTGEGSPRDPANRDAWRRFKRLVRDTVSTSTT